MPRKRRRPKLRVFAMDQALWRWLCDLAEPGDQESETVCSVEFFADPLDVAELWTLHGDEATATYARVYPGHRPLLWWRYSVPGAPFAHRNMVGSAGRVAFVGRYGIPYFVGTSVDDIRQIESSAAYLQRMRLFLPGEASRLRPEDFEPEGVGLDAEQ